MSQDKSNKLKLIAFIVAYESFGKTGDYIGIMEYRFECVNN